MNEMTLPSKFEPRRSEAEPATSRSRRLPTILSLYELAGKKHFVSLKLEEQSGVRTSDHLLSKCSGIFNHYSMAPETVLSDIIHEGDTVYILNKRCTFIIAVS